MKTIGDIFKNARANKAYSLSHLEALTKIKRNFIELIEEEKWNELPPFPTVLGFVKSISGALDVDEKMAVAVFKRDYPPKKLAITPKPDATKNVFWSPKQTFILGIIVVALLIFGYLGYQYYRFISPPYLSLESPKDGQTVKGTSVLVFGSTDTDAKIIANNQPIIVGDDGKFSGSLDVSDQTKEVLVRAISRSGKETDVSRKIIVEQ